MWQAGFFFLPHTDTKANPAHLDETLRCPYLTTWDNSVFSNLVWTSFKTKASKWTLSWEYFIILLFKYCLKCIHRNFNCELSEIDIECLGRFLELFAFWLYISSTKPGSISNVKPSLTYIYQYQWYIVQFGIFCYIKNGLKWIYIAFYLIKNHRKHIFGTDAQVLVP